MRTRALWPALLLLLSSQSAQAGPSPAAPPSPASAASVAPVAPPPTGPRPDDVLRWLELGNKAFTAGTPSRPHLDRARLQEVAKGQNPFATVLSCSDSRVPVEHLFDRGVGDLFVVRVAGNVADTDELGTVEYGVDHLGTPVLVVLGHTSCGAVTAVATGAEVHGHIPKLVDNIVPAVEQAKKGSAGSDPKTLVPAAIRANVFVAMADVITKSKEVRARLKEQKVKIVGAIYHLEDGHVEWLGQHPEQGALIERGDREAEKLALGSGGGAPAEGLAHGEHGGAEAQASKDAPLGAPWLFGVVAFLGALGGVVSGRLSARDD